MKSVVLFVLFMLLVSSLAMKIKSKEMIDEQAAVGEAAEEETNFEGRLQNQRCANCHVCFLLVFTFF